MPQCTVDRCDVPAAARGLCVKHYARWKRHGDPHAVKYRTGSLPESTKAKISESHKASFPKGAGSWAWQGNEVTYRGAHTRVRSMRGLASDYLCECGAKAQQWAFGHDPVDPSAIRQGEIQTRGRTFVVPYSPHVQDYVALCHSCHRKLDRAA
jgi:hypothetical protein